MAPALGDAVPSGRCGSGIESLAPPREPGQPRRERGKALSSMAGAAGALVVTRRYEGGLWSVDFGFGNGFRMRQSKAIPQLLMTDELFNATSYS